MTTDHCPTCGHAVKVVGDTTKHYEPTGCLRIEDEPHHYVTFDEMGWFVEHSIACRLAGTLGTCAYNTAVRHVVDDMDPHDPGNLGRWRITDIDAEGLPSLERA